MHAKAAILILCINSLLAQCFYEDIMKNNSKFSMDWPNYWCKLTFLNRDDQDQLAIELLMAAIERDPKPVEEMNWLIKRWIIKSARPFGNALLRDLANKGWTKPLRLLR